MQLKMLVSLMKRKTEVYLCFCGINIVSKWITLFISIWPLVNILPWRMLRLLSHTGHFHCSPNLTLLLLIISICVPQTHIWSVCISPWLRANWSAKPSLVNNSCRDKELYTQSSCVGLNAFIKWFARQIEITYNIDSNNM